MATTAAAMATTTDLGFEATELRLGLPGGGGGGGEPALGGEGRSSSSASGKRGFAETIDLKLKLEPAAVVEAEEEEEDHGVAVGALEKEEEAGKMKRSPSQSSVAAAAAVLADPAEKPRAAFVKVSLDGAPYLRKVDLKMYRSYQQLSKALENMFSSFTIIGSCGSQGMNGMNESKLVDLLNGSEYVPTYEDKDGDWMLVGDVPWEMFVESCKRLRIMKGSEAIGLAPRAMEKCKNRS